MNLSTLITEFLEIVEYTKCIINLYDMSIMPFAFMNVVILLFVYKPYGNELKVFYPCKTLN